MVREDLQAHKNLPRCVGMYDYYRSIATDNMSFAGNMGGWLLRFICYPRKNTLPRTPTRYHASNASHTLCPCNGSIMPRPTQWILPHPSAQQCKKSHTDTCTTAFTLRLLKLHKHTQYASALIPSDLLDFIIVVLVVFFVDSSSLIHLP